MSDNFSDLENSFLTEIKKLREFLSDKDRFDYFLENEAKPNKIFQEKEEEVQLFRKFENLLFENIIENSVRSTPFYHYTSLDSLLNIIKSGKLWFSCIVGLNDKSELNYSDLNIGLKEDETINQQRIRFANRRFLFSMSSKADDLNQWRLYGDDGKGACLEFLINDSYSRPTNSSFNWNFGKVRYNKKILSILKNAIQIVNDNFEEKEFSFKRFYNWRNFFKTDDYEYEKEHRVLIRKPKNSFNRDWKINRYNLLNSYIEVPFSTPSDQQDILVLNSIILGPKSSDDFQFKQWKHYCNNFLKGDLNVKKSSITHYR